MQARTPSSRVRPRSSSPDAQQERPTRRQRLIDSLPVSSGEDVVKDEKHYRTDGDCVIQVQRTLFKIHRYHLLEDSGSTVFQDLFSLPTGDVPCEGQTDSDPIIFSGDTVEQFRAFLSFVYSLPSQLQINRTSVDDIDKLVEIVPFAHKYLLQHCLRWALESIEHVLEHSAPVLSETRYSALLRASTLCESLHEGVSQRIAELIKFQWLTFIETDALRLAPALDVAESFRFKSFLGELYILALDRFSTSSDPTRAWIEGPLSGIGANHQLRIFAGHWLLAHALQNFFSVPLMGKHLPTCPVSSSCRQWTPVLWAQVYQGFRRECLLMNKPREIFQALERLKSTASMIFYRHRALVPCPAGNEIFSAVVAFRTTFIDQLFALSPHTAMAG
ncbi:BTB domain-containing protein [Favolaschia claudopus]|uniref:BTB domain-containing protein n=1 Tax=Favolaschia claudopus TaxID=2862362 RepID=A0AAW0DLM2_9AGAR